MIVIDINFLPQGEKKKDLEDLRKELEEHYECKILLIDGSTSNLQGAAVLGNAVYFVEA